MTLDPERTVLASILKNNQLVPEVESQLRPEHFSDPRNRVIFRAVLSLSEKDIGVDELTLRDHLQTTSELAQAGGIAYLSGLDDGLPRITDLSHFIRQVKDKALRKSALALGQRLVESAADLKIPTDEVIDRHAQQLNALLETHDTQTTQMIAEVLREAQRKLDAFVKSEGISGIPTGIVPLDYLTNGFQPGKLYVVAARPSRGKSVMLAQMTQAAATAGFPSLMFSLEMPPDSVVTRMWLADAQVDKWDLKLGHFDHEAQWEQLGRSHARLASLPLWFDKRESPTLTSIRGVVRKMKAMHGLRFVAVDYLQRIPVEKGVDRHIAVGDIAQGLKSIARAMDIPVVVACQLNRDAEEKRPTLADLAESGRIERECDDAYAIHPAEPSKWYEKADPVVELLTLKHREGATDTIKLSFERKLTRFVPVTTV